MPAADDDILELTQRVDEAGTDNVIDLGMEEEISEPVAAPPPPPPPRPVKATPRLQEKAPSMDSILSSGAASAALQGFSRLTSNMAVERGGESSKDAVTLEDIVRDMLRPMLREWLDIYLPPMIEKLVEKELEKLGRQARD